MNIILYYTRLNITSFVPVLLYYTSTSITPVLLYETSTGITPVLFCSGLIILIQVSWRGY